MRRQGLIASGNSPLASLLYTLARGLGLGLAHGLFPEPRDKAEKPATNKHPASEPHTTYVQAGWNALPPVAGVDLQAGFASWRSACITRLKTNPV